MYTYPISFPAETKSGGRIARKVSLYFCLPNVYGASVYKGQLISECLFDDFKFSKKPGQISAQDLKSGQINKVKAIL